MLLLIFILVCWLLILINLALAVKSYKLKCLKEGHNKVFSIEKIDKLVWHSWNMDECFSRKKVETSRDWYYSSTYVKQSQKQAINRFNKLITIQRVCLGILFLYLIGFIAYSIYQTF